MDTTFKTVFCIPAYKAEKTIVKVISSVAQFVEDKKDIIVSDDASPDGTSCEAATSSVTVLTCPINGGYGANQKILYQEALKRQANCIVMIHGDNQYDPSSIPTMIAAISKGADLVLGDRMATARKDGMPLWRWISNRFLTILQNRIYSRKLGEYHSGLRAYSTKLLRTLPFETYANGFAFDSQLIAGALGKKLTIKEITAHCYYHKDVSSVPFTKCISYGFSTLKILYDYSQGKYN